MAKRQPDPYDGPTTLGIDVSKWQGVVHWDKVVEDPAIKFAISRTGDGHTSDSRFVHNWRESKAVGLCRGSYHYFRADRDGKFQAELVLRHIEDAGGFSDTDLPPAIDIEGGATKNLPNGILAGQKDLPIPLVVEECHEFLQVLEDNLGCLPLVYTGQAFHWWLSQARPDMAREFARYPLWTPAYRKVPVVPADQAGKPFPWDHWTIWQYTAKGKVPGVSTPVDMNKFRGDEEAFFTFVKSLRSPEKPSSCSPPGLEPAIDNLVAQLSEFKKHLK